MLWESVLGVCGTKRSTASHSHRHPGRLAAHCSHLRLTQEAGTDSSPLAPLAAHRRVLGVIGIYYCPAIADIAKAYATFEANCRCMVLC